jgi:hypothetical protein
MTNNVCVVIALRHLTLILASGLYIAVTSREVPSRITNSFE